MEVSPRGMQLVSLISVKKLSRILQIIIITLFVVAIDDTLLEVAENGAEVVLVYSIVIEIEISSTNESFF